jgi:hypothetical protein
LGNYEILRRVADAMPNDAQVAYQHADPPHWDACDGMPGTFGWNDVVFQASFTTGTSTNELFAHANEVLAAQGWSGGEVEPNGGGLTAAWTRGRSSQTSNDIRVSLTNNTPDRKWMLFASAPPVGKRVSGC